VTDGPDITAQEDRVRRRAVRRTPDAGGNGQPAEARPRVPKRVLVACSACGTRFRTAVAAARRMTECVGCSAQVPVPGRDELTRAGDDGPAGRSRESRDSDADQDAGERPAKRRRRRRRKRIDAWATFFDGVFSFPWYEGVFSRWLLLSFGCSVVGIATVMMMYVALMGFVSAIWALRMAWGWSCILTFGYASACWIPIITETAAGSDRVEGWPEPYWKDWALDLVRFGFTALQAVAVAFGIAKLFELGMDTFWPPLLAGSFLLFPIFLLSSMHADSAWVPVTPPIVRSLLTCWWAWLMFYVEVAVMAVIWPGLALLGLLFEPWMTAISTGPLMAAVLLIYARLIGRLGWVITTTQARQRS
jgi:hypothetical protein